MIRVPGLVLLAFGLVVGASAAGSQTPPLLDEATVAALATEVSGTSALETVQELTLFHRQRGSSGFRAAARVIEDRARAFGLDAVETLKLPADGKVYYGTQRSRPAWDARFAELWQLEPTADGQWRRSRRLASWHDRPITLAQDSAGGGVTADLVDVGAGTSEADYAGHDVAGKLVLVAAQPGAAAPLAVERFGAAGMVSYAQNQHTAWWKEDENLVRWGHLETFPAPRTFAFMVSLKQARQWREALSRGERVRLEARVDAGQHAGTYDIPTATIPGRDPQLRREEIVYSCHLDHQRPGANDNASGCAAILEAGRALAKLIRENRIPAPRRTLRFVWPAEIEGTMALLEGHPELAARSRAVIHMDMVGGDPETTKAVFHVTRSPATLPSPVNDVAQAIAAFMNAESDAFAGTGEARYPLVDPAGGKEAWLAVDADFSMGSDHQVWSEGSWRVPAIYLNDWPDRYIHTHADSVANLDPTKLLRSAFLGAASGYYLANLDAAGLEELWPVMERHALQRGARALKRAGELRGESPAEAQNVLRFFLDQERRRLQSMTDFAPLSGPLRHRAHGFLDRLQELLAPGQGTFPRLTDDPIVYRRDPELRGPMSVFGYSYLEDHLQQRQLPRPGLLAFQGRWGSGSEYAYEALNLVDGRRTRGEIRDDLAAIYGPLPLELVAEYLETLEKIAVVERVP